MTTWMPVLVRIEDYEEITALVAAREAGRDSRDLPTVEFDLASPGARAPDALEARLSLRASWSVEDLKRLASGATVTTQRWTRAMDACTLAREAGEVWIPTSEVARRTDMGINEWRDAPRKISRHLKAEYPNVPKDNNGDAWWPLAAESDLIPANGGEVWWAITAEMAILWRQVRGDDFGRGLQSRDED